MADRNPNRRHRDKPYSRSANIRRSNTVMGWVGETVRGMFSAPSWMFRSATSTGGSEFENDAGQFSPEGSVRNPITVAGKFSDPTFVEERSCIFFIRIVELFHGVLAV